MSLPLRLRAKPEEPGHGVLLRLCARNGRTVMSSFATSLGIQMRDALAGREVPRIADLAGLPVRAIAWWSPEISAADRIVTVAGEQLSLGDWSVSSRRHCPDCLSADAEVAETNGLPADWFVSHRFWWDIRSIVACPEHGVALIDACANCAFPLGWRASSRLFCPRCRADLRTRSRPLHDPLGRYVAARLGVGGADRPAVLEDLPLRHAIRLCGRLGRAAFGGPPTVDTSGVPDPVTGAEGFARALTGPSGLDDVLDRALAARSRDASDGLGGAYGWLYNDWLGTDDPTALPYRHVLRHHAVTNGVIAADEDRLGSTPPPTINLTCAAAKAGIGIERMRQVLDDVGAIPRGSRRGVSFALDPRVVALVEYPRGAVRRAATEVLGVGRTALEGLVRSGHVAADNEQRLRASALKLLDQIDRQLCAGAPPPGTISLLAATVAASVPMSRVVETLLQGCIPAWRTGANIGLAGIVVRPVDIQPLRPQPDGFTGVAAARALGLHQECVRALVRDGTLARGLNGLIQPESIEAFQLAYVSGRELAREQSCSPRSLVAKLTEEGILPAWPLTTHRQALFRRCDLISPRGLIH